MRSLGWSSGMVALALTIGGIFDSSLFVLAAWAQSSTETDSTANQSPPAISVEPVPEAIATTPEPSTRELSTRDQIGSDTPDGLGDTILTPVRDAAVLHPLIPRSTTVAPLVARKSKAPIVAPAGDGAIITDIQVRFVDRAGKSVPGRTRPFIITREFDLKPGDVYTQSSAQQGLKRLSELDIVENVSLTLEPTSEPGRVVMVVDVVEAGSFSASYGVDADEPSVLQGPTLPGTVSAAPGETTEFSAGASLQLRNLGGNNQSLALGVEGGTKLLGLDLTFTDPWIGGDPYRTGYGVNLFNRRYVGSVFTGGDRRVRLPNGEEPWIHRLGGGVQLTRPLTSALKVALGVSYQRVSVRDDIFTGKIEPVDQLGNRLTFSDTGQDDLLTVNFAAILDYRDDSDYPTQGSVLRFGVDQSIPIGNGSILFNRLTANYTQYIPVRFFGFSKGPRTLLLNVQSGTVIGDLPPYEAFDLNGAVRGYRRDLGAGRSFVQASAEYRFPITSLRLFENAIDLRGVLFIDYASDLGTADNVPGEPSVVRRKADSGLGYGVGLQARTPIGLVRFELGFSDQGDSEFNVSLGDRF